MNKPSDFFGTARPGRALAGLVLAGAGLICGVAQARPEFPPDIARHLSASVDPACSICHLEGKTGGITVVTPFALALRAHGFTESSATLNAALDQMAADGTDTDGDGVPDVEELRAGTDPNSPVLGATTADPRYGCGVASGPWRPAWLAPGLIVAAAALRRRARRRERPRPFSAAAARPSSASLRGPR